MNESFQPDTALSSNSSPCICNRTGSHPIMRFLTTLNSFSMILIERHLPQRNVAPIYSPLVRTGSSENTIITSEEYIKWLKGYYGEFFYGVTVNLLKPPPVSAMRCSFRVNDNAQNPQMYAGQILKV